MILKSDYIKRNMQNEHIIKEFPDYEERKMYVEGRWKKYSADIAKTKLDNKNNTIKQEILITK